MKEFWKNYIEHYREDKLALAFVILAGLVALVGAVYFPKMSPVILVIAYICSDPVVFYVRTYRHIKDTPDISQIVPNMKRPNCSHEPYTHDQNGKEILGTKRCKHCGLNEAYWRLA